jgi:hypothetical protein
MPSRIPSEDSKQQYFRDLADTEIVLFTPGNTALKRYPPVRRQNKVAKHYVMFKVDITGTAGTQNGFLFETQKRSNDEERRVRCRVDAARNEIK